LLEYSAENELVKIDLLDAGGSWITTRQTSRRPKDRSTSVGRQLGKPGWLATVVNLTGDTARGLELAEWSGRRRGKSAT